MNPASGGRYSPFLTDAGFNFLEVDMISGLKLVHGVGFNDADYPVTSPVRCRYYAKWTDMLMRCYSISYQNKNPKYLGRTVCEDWLLFSKFYDWMSRQDWRGKELDKDLLGDGKLYSPETCCFISRSLNAFLVGSISNSGSYWNKSAKKYQASCRNPFTKKSENLGLFESEIDARNAWRLKKLKHAVALSADIKDDEIKSALIARYTNVKQ